MQVARAVSLAAIAALIASPLVAQQDTTHGKMVSAVAKTNSQGKAKGQAKKEDLKALAKITKDSAKKVALAQVAAGSKVKGSELEREKNTIVYSFDITVPGKTGVDEILVSALDGSVLSHEHETPKQEKAEKKEEKNEKKKDGKKG